MVAPRPDRCFGPRGAMLDSMTLNARIIFKLAAALLLIALAHPAGAFHATLAKTESGAILRLRGDLRMGDYSRFKAILEKETLVGLGPVVI